MSGQHHKSERVNYRQFKSFLEKFDSEYRDVPCHTEVRWLSRGKVLNSCFELREEILSVYEKQKERPN